MNQHKGTAATVTSITVSRAATIRDRFLTNAANSRAQSAAFDAKGDHTNAAALARLAESQERMATKRYEAMTIRAA